MSVGLLFPGQGSQFVGMGADLFDARPDLLGAAADEIVGFSLREMCLDGPEEDLTRTEHAQPALFALSYALWDSMAGAGLTPVGAAGHSLGEYTALTAAGFLDYLDALSVVAGRGQAMARAAVVGRSGMAAMIGADQALAEEIASRRRSEGGHLQVANVNAPGQVVVAGSEEDIEWLVASAGDMGVRRAIPLKVSGAFHSSFMEPAAVELSSILAGIVVSPPEFPVWANTTARPHDPATVKDELVRQVVSPVLFSASLEDMASEGIDVFVHVGPGDVTAGLARKTIADATVIVVSTLDDVEAAVGTVGTMG